MTLVSGSPDPARLDEIKAEVDAVLSSQTFGRSPSLAQFLTYVCAKALAGEAHQIKEYNIAVEAFGRQADFDQKEDAIVRVEAHRLRKRLKLYYETEGANHPIQIVIPPGQYAPQFLEKGAAARCPDGASTELVRAETPEVLPPLPCDPNGKVEPAGLLAKPSRVRGRHVGIAALAAGIVTLGVGAAYLTRTRSESAPDAGPERSVTAAVRFSEGDVIRIAAGSTEMKQMDSSGNTWSGDRYYSGGSSVSHNLKVQRTRDAFLYQHRREGDFRYDIPLKPGRYELHLHFSEPVFGTGNLAGGGETSRIFNVLVNDQAVMWAFDILSDAGGANTANIKVFKDIAPAPDGYLHLRFAPQKDGAIVNGIAIYPGIPGRMHPVRIAAGDTDVRDQAGNLWPADRFVSGGQTVARPDPVEGTADPELYKSERFGNFNYAVPVAPGRYTVNLRFAEVWFGPGKPATGGAGSRIFDVYCNGTTLLKEFDVFKAAGGPNRAVERSFRGLAPNAQGKLVLSFVPVRNYALVNAIEVVAEGK